MKKSRFFKLRQLFQDFLFQTVDVWTSVRYSNKIPFIWGFTVIKWGWYHKKANHIFLIVKKFCRNCPWTQKPLFKILFFYQKELNLFKNNLLQYTRWCLIGNFFPIFNLPCEIHEKRQFGTDSNHHRFLKNARKCVVETY